MSLNVTRKLEQTQCSATLAVTGARRGTNRQRLYEELGWENLYERWWYICLCHFYSLKISATLKYLFKEALFYGLDIDRSTIYRENSI